MLHVDENEGHDWVSASSTEMSMVLEQLSGHDVEDAQIWCDKRGSST